MPPGNARPSRGRLMRTQSVLPHSLSGDIKQSAGQRATNDTRKEQRHCAGAPTWRRSWSPVGERAAVVIDRAVDRADRRSTTGGGRPWSPVPAIRHPLSARLLTLIEYFLARRLHRRVFLSACGAPSSMGAPASVAPTQARLKYALNPAGLIDLAAVLPFWLALVTALRISASCWCSAWCAFFKIARYLQPAMRSLLDVLVPRAPRPCSATW